MQRRRLGALAAIPFFAGAIMIGSANTASAAPSDNSSCVAQWVHNPDIGPPGQTQRYFHEPRFGPNVSRVAHFTHGDCYPF